MYPTRADAKAEALYGEPYKDLDAAKQATVAGAVYLELPTCFPSDAARTAVRDNIATTYFGAAYALLSGTLKNMVDQIISGSIDSTNPDGTPVLGFGPHLERDYVDFFAVPGAIAGWGKEVAEAVTLENTTAGTVLAGLNWTSVQYFLDQVAAGAHMRQAFYQGLAWTGVYGLGGVSALIAMAMGEFTLTIDNKWDGTISIDNMSVNVYMKNNAYGLYPERDVDVAKAALGDKVYVPPEGVMLKLNLPIKRYDIMVWLIMAGLDATTAGTYAAACWGAISPNSGAPGTPSFYMTIEATISSTGVAVPETITKTYDLEWLFVT